MAEIGVSPRRENSPAISARTKAMSASGRWENRIDRRESPKSALEPFVVGAIIIVGLYLGRSILVPLAMAVVLSFVLSPFVQMLRRLRIPRLVSISIVSAIALLSVIAVGVTLARQVVTFADDLPRYQSGLIQKIKSLRDMAGSGSAMGRAADTLKTIRDKIEEPAVSPTPGPSSKPSTSPAPTGPIPVTVEQPVSSLEQLQRSAAVIAEPFATFAFITVFVVILLIYREDVRDRVIRIFGVHDLETTTRAMDDAGQRLNLYFQTTTAINAVFGAVIGLGLWLIGVPNPILWGVLSFALRFIPFAGVPIAALMPLMLSLVVDPGWTMVVLTLVLFITVELIVSQIIESLVQGEATGLSPVALILATTFWTLLWGPIGLFLAVPLTVILAVAGRHIESFEMLEVMLGNEPALSTSDRFHQRILSKDPDEAAELAQAALSDMSLVDYYDGVVMKTIDRTLLDNRRGKLSAERLDEIIASLRDFNVIMTETATEPSMPGPAVVEGGTSVPVRSIVCIGDKPGLADTAAILLAHLLTDRGYVTTAISAADILAEPDPQTSHVVICGIDQPGAALKFLARRIQRRLPNAEIIGLLRPIHRSDDGASQAGLTDIVYSLKEACDRVSAQAAEGVVQSGAPDTRSVA